MKRCHDIGSFTGELAAKVALVERNNCPGGLPLVSATKIAKKDHNDLVELAMEIQKADTFVNATACNKLQVIAQQVRFLQEQAKQILNDAKVNTDLHHVACNFVKVSGNVYHLYKRSSGQLFFSMLSPQEWRNSHQYIGSFRLESDQSWTPVENIEAKDNELLLIHKILSTQSGQPSLSYVLQETPMDL